MDDKSYYVYCLTNNYLNVIYIGITNDLVRRIFEHKTKFNKGFTEKYNVNRLVYYEIYYDIGNAITREKQMKGWSRQKKNQLISQFNPLWEDLYSTLL